MQITRAGEYAIIGLLYLARQPADRTVMIDEISAAEKVPNSFLAKIFQSLAKSGLVQSQRGAGGGFTHASIRQPLVASVVNRGSNLCGTLVRSISRGSFHGAQFRSYSGRDLQVTPDCAPSLESVVMILSRHHSVDSSSPRACCGRAEPAGARDRVHRWKVAFVTWVEAV